MEILFILYNLKYNLMKDNIIREGDTFTYLDILGNVQTRICKKREVDTWNGFKDINGINPYTKIKTKNEKNLL